MKKNTISALTAILLMMAILYAFDPDAPPQLPKNQPSTSQRLAGAFASPAQADGWILGPVSPVPTATPSPTASPTATATATPTLSPVPTLSPSPSISLTVTPTPVGTATPSPTASPFVTPSISLTGTPTPVGTATPSPTASPSPTPDIAALRCECQDNLRQIEKATRQWMFDNRQRLDAVPEWADLVGADKYLASQPACPAGGSYTLAGGGDYPACSLAESAPALHVYTDTPCEALADPTLQRCICRDNLVALQRAKLEYLVDHGISLMGNEPSWIAYEPTWSELIGADKYLKTTPACPAGGTYSLKGGDADVACSLIESHQHSIADNVSCSTGAEERRGECQANLRAIEKAKEVFANGYGFVLGDGNYPTWDDLIDSTSYLRYTPVCPDGGTYTRGYLSEMATCSLEEVAPFLHTFSDQPPGLSATEARAECQDRLRAIKQAVTQWMVDNRGTTQDVPSWGDLVGDGKYLRYTPECPAGGVYTLSPADGIPSCSLETDTSFPHSFTLARTCRTSSWDTEADRHRGCQENLRAIAKAKHAIAQERGLVDGDAVAWEDLIGPDGYIPITPVCPVDGNYELGAVGQPPSCSLALVSPYLHTYDEQPAGPLHLSRRNIEGFRSSHCYWNKYDVTVALHRWAAIEQPAADTVPTWQQLLEGGYLEALPICLGGGDYTLINDENLGVTVTCSLRNQDGWPHNDPISAPELDPCWEGKRLRELSLGTEGGVPHFGVADCRAKLQLIDELKQKWAGNTGAPGDQIPTLGDLLGTLNCADTLVPAGFSCLAGGGSISYGPVSEPPHCTLEARGNSPHGINTIEGGYNSRENTVRTIEQLRRDDCVENLRAYHEATISWAADTSATLEAVPTLADLMPYLRYERLCPTGGVYTFAPAGQNPNCSREALAKFPHVLPDAPINFAGQRCQCQDNLRQIEKATRQWMFDNRQRLDAVPEWADLVGADKYLASQPACPAGGSYTLAGGGDYPACSLAESAPALHVYTVNPCTDPLDDAARECICHDNLMLIQKAKIEYYADFRLDPGAPAPTWEDLIGPDKYLKTSPVCPSGGTYSINMLHWRIPDETANAECSLADYGDEFAEYYPHSIRDGRHCAASVVQARLACQENLRQIQNAKEHWYRLVAGLVYRPGPPAWFDLVGSELDFMAYKPICPDGGIYLSRSMDELPICSLESATPYLHTFSENPGNLNRAEARDNCQDNLRRIHLATRRWMVDQRMTVTDLPTWEDLVGATRYLRVSPECPGGGIYTLSPAKELPTCTLELAASFPHAYSSSLAPRLADGDTERERRCICQENLRAIDTAKAALSKEWGLSKTATPSWDELIEQTGYLHTMPACPVGGSYNIGSIGERPSCSLDVVTPYLHVYSSAPCAFPVDSWRMMEYRRVSECQRNQAAIYDAIARWTEETDPPPHQTPTWGDLLADDKYLRESPLCPSGGAYTLHPIAEITPPVECSLAADEIGWFEHRFEDFPIACSSDARSIDLIAEGDDPSLAGLCRLRLRAIDDLKQKWAKTSAAPPNAEPTWSDLLNSLDCTPDPYYSFSWCKLGAGLITIGPVNAPPSCSNDDYHYWPHDIGNTAGSYPPYNQAVRTIEQLRRDDCVENLNAYRQATISWAADTSATLEAVPTLADLMPYLRYERLCPTGGVYTLMPAHYVPTCSRSTLPEFPHILPPSAEDIAALRCQCQDNLRRIEKATRQWMLDNRQRLDAVPEWADLVGADRYLSSQPVCPEGGTYQLADGAGYPSCTLESTAPWLHAYSTVACTDPADKQARACACRDNLQIIRTAKLKFIVDHRLPLSALPTWDDLIGPDKYIKASPVCPSGGVYTLYSGNSDPFCSLWISEKHNLGSDYHCSPTQEARRGECQKRLRMIEEAKELWANEAGYYYDYFHGDPQASWSDLVGNSSYLRTSPVCPDGGTYSINPLSMTATCSLETVDPQFHTYTDKPYGLSHSAARAACQERLRAIRESTSRWMVDNRKTAEDVPEWSDLVGYGKYLRHSPECAGGGVYTLTSANGLPTCSLSSDPVFPHGYNPVRTYLASQEDCEADRRGGCQENMRAVQEAKQLLAKELQLAGDATPTWEQLVGPGRYLPVMPVCPVDGVYTLGTIDEEPSCSLETVAPYLHVYAVGIPAGTNPTIRAIENARRYDCVRNQIVVFEAVRMWSETVHPAPGTEPTWDDLLQGGYLQEIPVCQSGGTYQFRFATNPLHPFRCSLEFANNFSHAYWPLYPDACAVQDRLDGSHWREAGDLSSRVALCRILLKTILDLKERWADATGAPANAIPTASNLLPYAECDSNYCPSCLGDCPGDDGDITIGPVSEPPHCTVESRAFLPHGINTVAGAYPPYNKAARTIEQLRRDDCVENLRAYREATISWAADTSATLEAVPTLPDLMPYLRYGRLCPTDGVYTFAPAGQNPTCSRETLAEFPHALAP